MVSNVHRDDLSTWNGKSPSSPGSDSKDHEIEDEYMY